MSPRIGTATEAGLDPARLQQTYALLDHWAQSGRVPGGVLAVARQGVLVPPRAFGQRRLAGTSQPMEADAVFLVASVTKPVTALAERVAEVNLPEEEQRLDWTWNQPYWQHFGAPWGGMFSTVADLAALLQLLLEEGQGLLGVQTARAMVADQTSRLPGLSPEERQRAQAWALGWCVGNWADLGSARSFWHGGATGTLVGADPESGLLCALFTTQPDGPLYYAVNAVQGAVV